MKNGGGMPGKKHGFQGSTPASMSPRGRETRIANMMVLGVGDVCYAGMAGGMRNSYNRQSRKASLVGPDGARRLGA